MSVCRITALDIKPNLERQVLYSSSILKCKGMKKGVQILITSFLSAALAVFLFSKFVGPQEIIIEKPIAIPAYNSTPYPAQNVQSASNSTVTAPSNLPTNFTAAANKATPAVVYIRSKQVVDQNFWRGEQIGIASGSGVIISSDGYVATNNHVVENSKEITVELDDKREFKATLVGSDPSTDIALLKINEEDLPFIRFGNSDHINVGEWVLAVGNPFRLQSTVTAGIVSAKARNIDILRSVEGGIESFIQTDAAVNRGNSGGALVNTDGDLIGINTAIITETGNYEGYSFAVPSNLVAKVIQDLKNHGAVQRGWMGVSIVDVDQNRARSLGLDEIKGIYLSNIVGGSAAERAGLQRGDVVVSINGKETESVAEFMEIVGQQRPGDEIDVKFIRNKRNRNTSVRLGSKLTSKGITSNDIIEERDDEILKDIGFELRELTRAEKEKYETDGIKVVRVISDSKIDQINMEKEYVITSVNNQQITSVDDFIQTYKDAERRIFIDGFYDGERDSFQYLLRK